MPTCDKCGSEMMLRTARRGPNTGKEFWGCKAYPACKNILNITEAPVENGPHPAPPKPESPHKSSQKPFQLPVDWVEKNFREDWVPEYVTIGSISTSLDKKGTLVDDISRRALSQTLFLYNRKNSSIETNSENKILSAVLNKILQRGNCPLPTLHLDYALLREHNLLEYVEDHSGSGFEVGCKWKQSSIKKKALLKRLCQRAEFAAPDNFQTLFDSPVEKEFFLDWLLYEVPEAAPWVHPQASLDSLLESMGHIEATAGARRVDFLFCHPFGDPLVIELDGDEHQSAKAVDRIRDTILGELGIVVVRVPNSEVEDGSGPNLDRAEAHIKSIFALQERYESDDVTDYVFDCTFGSKLQMALVKAVEKALLTKSPCWSIEIRGLNSYFSAALLDIIQIADSVQEIFGFDVLPDTLNLNFDDRAVGISRSPSGWELSHGTPAVDPIIIAVEKALSPYHKTISGTSADAPDIIVRPTFLPINLSAGKPYTQGRIFSHAESVEKLRRSLVVLLQQVFRKTDFREGQAEAIFNALRGVDTIVLLPTGAGKSIIYQLTGLILPGITFVVDPLVSLIEDQVEGLASYGIDRVLGITSASGTPEEKRQLLYCTEKGEYYFVLMSPERLQSPHFRETLKSISQSSLVNLAVIDEAHCVSEWGHDFRPSYLNLGRNLRTFGKDLSDMAPPLLGLTGTASRAVLRDLLVDLGIDNSRSEALIKPQSFNRSELNFEIRKIKPGDESSTIKGILTALPDKFNANSADFYASRGDYTFSGIVFNRFVNGKKGLVDLRNTVRSATRTPVSLFSGKCPQGIDSATWESEKRAQAASFKQNSAPILVSTKAFGMGIDKANVRYTIHNGMPTSLEAFYQEAGRAGRSRDKAYCYVVFCENDEKAAQSFVDSTASLAELKTRIESVNRTDSDDTRDAVWFHLNSFSGVEEELKTVKSILKSIGDLGKTRSIELPRIENYRNLDDAKNREKAVHRLVQCGAIKDYEVDFGAQKFTLHLNAYNRQRCADAILEYVRRSQPGRAEAVNRELNAVTEMSPQDELIKFCRILLDFSYDVIERSRRRAIQEAMETVRRAQGDADFRKRLLDYLQEGVGHEAIEALLDETSFHFSSWSKLLDNVHNPMEAGELRGMAIRFLESYPNHPGLLVMRAITEAMCSETDDTFCYESLINSFGSGGEKYSLSQSELFDGLQTVFAIAKQRAKKLLPSFAYAVTRLHAEGYLDASSYEKIRSNVIKSGGDDVHMVFLPSLMNSLISSCHELAQEVSSFQLS